LTINIKRFIIKVVSAFKNKYNTQGIKNGGENMRWQLQFELSNEFLIRDYRRCIISYFKHALMQYENGKYYNEFYSDKPSAKQFCFSVYLGKSIFKKSIIVEGRLISVLLSCIDYNTSIILYNAFNAQRFKPFKLPFNNFMTLKNIVLLPRKKITTSNANIKMLSPLIIRHHDLISNKDKYYSVKSSDFSSQAISSVKSQLYSLGIFQDDIISSFRIIPKDAKRTVVELFNQKIEASIGTFEIYAVPPLMEYLYYAGIGQRRGAGFGLFEII